MGEAMLNERERLTQMENLSMELAENRTALRALTTALNQMQGGAQWALRLGSVLALGVAALWAIVSWGFATFGRHS
jgi:hypothetical protein